MEAIIDPISVKDLEAELTPAKLVRQSNNGSNLIYIITHHNSPLVMKEIGRLRELTFREAGGGTGKAIDIDEYDYCEQPYRQLIVWNPVEKEIMGGYRFIKCIDAIDPVTKKLSLATAELFDFSAVFIKDYLPHTIELGRSFVQPKYQPSAENRKGLFTLDNLWDGLGAIAVDHPEIKYFFGKVTMYRHYNQRARDMILFFMDYYFPDPDRLVTPKQSLPITHNLIEFGNELKGLNYKDGHRILNHHVRELEENIPPLINSYMNLSASMKNFGTALNTHFGEVEETGILVTLADIYETKKSRHVDTYIAAKKSA